MLGLHGRLAIIALLPILAWGTLYAARSREASVVVPHINIGIEHEQPVRVRITHSIGATPTIVDIANTSSGELIYITVPQDWRRGEVRGAPLSLIRSDEPSLGYKRWHVPTETEISFQSTHELRDVTVQNPSKKPLNIDVISINVQTQKTERSSYLLTDASLPISLQ